MQYQQIRYEVSQAVATLTLHRPERLNAWTAQMGEEMRHALAEAEADPGVVVIVLTGAGRGFCAGADVSTLDALSKARPPSGGPAAEVDYPGEPAMGPSFRGPFSYPMSILKPIVGAINGPCVGLGLAIALACDIRIASDEASFSTAFARLGLVSEWGVSWMLPRLVGTAHTLDLLLSARTLDAAEAQQIGLVNRVVSRDELMLEVRKYAVAIATQCAPRSLSVIKRDVLKHLTGTLQEAERDALEHMLASFTRSDFREALVSRAEKRPAKFEPVGKQPARGGAGT